MTCLKKIRASGELFLPFYNLWNQNVYRTDKPFSFAPNHLRSNSTSGSPVILGRDFFVGFTTPEREARFESDGESLGVYGSNPDVLFFREGDPYKAWMEYNQLVAGKLPGFGKKVSSGLLETLSSIEYCTWVEQKRLSESKGQPEMAGSVAHMTHGFVENLLERIENLSFPKGVFTMDHGWAQGADEFRFTETIPDAEKFPDLAKTVRMIRQAGHIPGLWFAPGFLYPDHPFFKKYPNLLGTRFTGANEGGFQFPVCYFKTSPETEDILQEHFQKLFDPYVKLGFRKFKIDFLYNEKDQMREILRILRKAVKALSPDVEIESHIPDIFASVHQDSVRLNDIVVEGNPGWESLLRDHYEVCRHSAFGTMLNLDHLGTNSPFIDEGDFLKTIEVFEGMEGYPVVSLLPDHFSKKTQERTRLYLEGYERRKSAVYQTLCEPAANTATP